MIYGASLSRCFTIAVSEEGFLIHPAIRKPDLQVVVAVSLKRVWKSSVPHEYTLFVPQVHYAPTKRESIS